MNVIRKVVNRVSDLNSRVMAHATLAAFSIMTAMPAWAQFATERRGVSGLFGNLGNTAQSFIKLASIVAVAIGVAAVMYGLAMMIKKGMGRGDDIEWRQILWPLLGGAMISVVMFILYSLVEEVGADRDELGDAWTVR